MHKILLIIINYQSKYFQVVTSAAFPLLPFSSTKHTPQALK
jgi:hypothetical protein